jgi:hypothetical protein
MIRTQAAKLQKSKKWPPAPLGKLIPIGIDAGNVRFVCY